MNLSYDKSEARDGLSDAEAAFVSCTNLPTYDVIAPIEEELGKLVITANQVNKWAALRQAGARAVGTDQRLLATV